MGRFFKLEKFLKNLKINEKIIIFENVLRKFWDFLKKIKFYRNFRENLGKNLENMEL